VGADDMWTWGKAENGGRFVWRNDMVAALDQRGYKLQGDFCISWRAFRVGVTRIGA
jgi:hypothetical protein